MNRRNSLFILMNKHAGLYHAVEKKKMTRSLATWGDGRHRVPCSASQLALARIGWECQTQVQAGWQPAIAQLTS